MAVSPSQNHQDRLYTLADRGEYREIIKIIRKHTDENVRYGAAGVLSESLRDFKSDLSSAKLKNLISSVLNDPNDAVRAHVLRVLIEINEDIVDNIITRLKMNPQSTPNKTPYPLILTKWHGSSHPELRYLAVVGFGRDGSDASINRIRTTLKKEQNVLVVKRAISEAGRVADPRVVTPVQNHLRVEPDHYQASADTSDIKQIKRAAVEALVDIGTNAAYEALVSASRSTDEDLREYVIGEIGRFGAQDTVDMILDELNDESGDSLQETAAEGLITSVADADAKDSHEIRERTIEEIGDTISPDVSEKFASIVENSPHNTERRNAAWLIGQTQTDDKNSVECLSECLIADDEYLRKIAAASLTKMDEQTVRDSMDDLIDQYREGSDVCSLAKFVRSSVVDGGEQAKKEVVEYTYVSDPEDYTSQQ